MSFDAQSLFALLPSVLRLRDAPQAVFSPGWLGSGTHAEYVELKTLIDAAHPLTPAQKDRFELLRREALAGPLASFIAVLAEQIHLLEDDLEQLYDDQFIETCAEWVAPYIGDLIGYRMLHGVVPAVASPRAEVAHTIAYRRRKGTVIVLEQLARDVTDWNAAAVEFFQRLVMTQSMIHLRPFCVAAPDLRRWEPLARRGTAFDTIMHTVDVRRIASGRGRYNIPSIGLFLWRLKAYPLSDSPAVAVDGRRWRFHPLGIDQPVSTRPRTIEPFEQRTTPLDVPEAIRRRVLAERLDDYYTTADVLKSLSLRESSSGDFQPVPPSRIRVCSLHDEGGTWAHLPADDKIVVDPQLGRIGLPADLPQDTAVRVDFHYAFGGELGGGEYERAVADEEPPPHLLEVPGDFANLQDAVAALGGDGGVVLITDSGRYEETLAIAAPAQRSVELRADNGCRPTVILREELGLSGGESSGIRLAGLLIAGAPLRVGAGADNRLARLDLSHCTLVPGWTLDADSTPGHPDEPSLVIEIGAVDAVLSRSITGALRVAASSTVKAADSIIDATAATGVAYAAQDGVGAGGALELVNCTVIGQVHALTLPLVSNSILLARLADVDPWPAPVIAERRQEGCVRFTYLPESSRTPRRFRCLPESAASPALAVPCFTSLRYGFPAYAQLAETSGAQLLTGADNESQPGAFNFLFQPQRVSNLRVRLDEYLRSGLEAGIFFES